MAHELDDVRVFAQVVDAGSFTAAGRALSLPTSVVSRRVARLEERLGVRLLQRTTRTLSVTEAGRLYHECGARVLAELDEAERALAQLRQRPRGRVRVTAPVEEYATIRLVTRFLAAYPEVQVELELTNRQVNLVEEGFDVALRAGPQPDSTLIAQKVLDSPFWLVASPAYLKRRGEPRQLADLRAHDAIVFGATMTEATWTLRGAKGPVRVPLRGRISVNHMQAARAAALAGLGIAMLPSIFCAPDLRARRLRPVLQSASPPPIPVFVVYRSGRLLAPAVRAFVDFARTSFAAIFESS
jgi:DNA-binding transcriptional LysR family regulator